MNSPTDLPHRFVATTRGSNRDQVRRHNLSAVLALLSRSGAMPRSALTELTGLNRSTISDLVTELEDLGLATEAEAQSHRGVGRPSIIVAPSEEVIAFAVNPDVDATTVGAVTLGGHVVAKTREPARGLQTPTEVVETVNKLVSQMRKELPENFRVAAVGVAIPGQVRVVDGVVRLAPHMQWDEVPFGRMLQQKLGLPVFIDNDASLASLAERDFGAGKGFREIVYLFGSSRGIGGGVIHDGIPLRGAAGYAGELGHVRISDSPIADGSGLTGTLESLVRREVMLQALGISNVDDDELAALLKTDKSSKVRKIAEAQLDALAIAVGNYVNIFNPEVILLSGYLAALYGFDPDRLLKRFPWSSLNPAQDRLVVRPGELGANLLMVGAAGLALSPLISQPSRTQLYPMRESPK